MVTQTHGPALLGGVFSDAARAQQAFDALMSLAAGSAGDLDVAFYGSGGEYLVLVSARSQGAEDWAARVLREHEAAVEEERFLGLLRSAHTKLAHDLSQADERPPDERSLLAHWAAVLVLLLDRGLVQPGDLLALLVASRSRPQEPEDESATRIDASSPQERRRRLAEADAELRDVSERLQASLRARHPELFDRRGRLRAAALVRRLAAQTGGKSTLSGDELFALEREADARAGRSADAP
ncbi:MAG: hypothetical protein HY690_00185 [Chloroflexi bacterium]|nr:hypothetical protein [Chloroflexota bacterium]